MTQPEAERGSGSHAPLPTHVSPQAAAQRAAKHKIPIVLSASARYDTENYNDAKNNMICDLLYE